MYFWVQASTINWLELSQFLIPNREKSRWTYLSPSMWGQGLGTTVGGDSEDFSGLTLTSFSLALSLPVNFLKQSEILSLLDLKSLVVPTTFSSKSRAFHVLTFVPLCTALCAATSHTLCLQLYWNPVPLVMLKMNPQCLCTYHSPRPNSSLPYKNSNSGYMPSAYFPGLMYMILDSTLSR